MKTYFHKHHIIPKHMGGTNHPSNLVKLTVSGHAAVHLWLYEEYGRWQDKLAWLTLEKLKDRTEIIRLVHQETLKRCWKDPEYIANRKKKSSEDMYKRWSDPNWAKKIWDATWGRSGYKEARSKKTTEQNNKRWKNEENRKKQSLKMKEKWLEHGYKEKVFKKKQCPHCKNWHTPSNASRWHFENCKLK